MPTVKQPTVIAEAESKLRYPRAQKSGCISTNIESFLLTKLIPIILSIGSLIIYYLEYFWFSDYLSKEDRTCVCTLLVKEGPKIRITHFLKRAIATSNSEL